MELLLKALAGAAMVVLIQLIARTPNFFIAGLVPLFPTFTLISNYIVASERTASEFKQTLLFSMFAIIPYAGYFVTLYFLIDHLPLNTAILGAVACWVVLAVLLVLIWGRVH